MDNVKLVDAVYAKLGTYAAKISELEHKLETINKEITEREDLHERWLKVHKDVRHEIELELFDIRRERDDLAKGYRVLKEMKLRADQGKEEV